MKKNLVLILVLCALIFIAFLIEERVKLNEFNESVQTQKVIKEKFENLNRVILPKFSLVNTSTWKLADSMYPVSNEFLKKIVDELSSLKLVQELKYNESDLKSFFQYQDHLIRLEFDQKEINLRLGDVNQITGYFYLLYSKKNESKLYLVELDNNFTRAYQDEVQKRMIQYIEFKNLISAKAGVALKDGLSYLIDWKNLNRVELDPNLYRSFEVIDSGIISPLPPKGIQVIKNVYSNLQKIMDDVILEEVIKKEEMPLDLISKISFFENDKEVKFELFRTYKNENAAFLSLSSYPDFLFKLNSEKLSFFSLNHQDFWNKKIHFDVDFASLNKVEFILSFPREKRSEKFLVEDFETFKVIPKNSKLIISQNFFNLLFNIVFGGAEFKQARLVGELKDLKINASDFEMEISILDRKLKLQVVSKHIFIIDDENKYYLQYDYDLGNLTPTSSKNFFKD